MRKLFYFILIVFVANLTYARDFYVKSGARRGKGTLKRPYKGIYKALKKAVKGDVIHVAQGFYYGKLRAGYIIVQGRGITLLGGYNDDFTKRNPWKYHTVITGHPKSKARTFDRGIVYFPDDHTNFIIDGFILDAHTRNKYKGDGSLDVSRSRTNPPISLTSPNCHIRNCMILNAAFSAIRVIGHKSSITNCIIVNNVYAGIDAYGSIDDTEILIKNNTIVRTWYRYKGVAINIGSKSKITMEKNIFAYNDTFAVANLRNTPGHVMNENVFFKNPKGHYIFFHEENKGTLVIDDLDDLEDSDLDKSEDNLEADPQYKFVLKEEVKKEVKKPVKKEKKSNDPFASDNENDPFASKEEEKKDDIFGGNNEKKKEVQKKKAFAPRMPIEVAFGYLKAYNDEVKGLGVQPEGPFPIVKAKAKAKVKRDYEVIDAYVLAKKKTELRGKAVKVKCCMQSLAAFLPSYLDKNYIQGVTSKSHSYAKLKGTAKAGYTLFVAFVPKGTSAEVYLKKVRPVPSWKKPARKQIFWVKGIVVAIPKMRKGAIAILVDDITKDNLKREDIADLQGSAMFNILK